MTPQESKELLIQLILVLESHDILPFDHPHSFDEKGFQELLHDFKHLMLAELGLEVKIAGNNNLTSVNRN